MQTRVWTKKTTLSASNAYLASTVTKKGTLGTWFLNPGNIFASISRKRVYHGIVITACVFCVCLHNRRICAYHPTDINSNYSVTLIEIGIKII